MITVQIKVKWYDYWTKKYGPKREHYTAIVGDKTSLTTDEYASDHVFVLRMETDWEAQPKGYDRGNPGIYSGANCRQYLQFWDGKKLLKEFEWKERPGKEGLLAQKVHIENWIKQCIELSKVDILN